MMDSLFYLVLVTFCKLFSSILSFYMFLLRSKIGKKKVKKTSLIKIKILVNPGNIIEIAFFQNSLKSIYNTYTYKQMQPLVTRQRRTGVHKDMV